MKLSVFKKACLTVMGVGIVSSLVSVGTFATFTATTTNPGNSFAAGVLTITDIAAGTFAPAIGGVNPNVTGAASALINGASDCTATLNSACKTVIKTSNVAAAGMEPGQYVEGTITLTNPAGNLPGIFALQIQNIKSLANTTNCPSDINSAGGSGGVCSPLGSGLNITIEDNNGPAPGAQCIYGKASTPVATAGTGAGWIAVTTGGCDDITGAALTAAVNANALYGDGTASNGIAAFGSILANGASAKPIYIPGATSTGAATVDTSTINRWLAAESHVLKIRIGFPNTGTTTAVVGGNTVQNGKEDKYVGGSVSFDLVTIATQ